MKDSTKSDIFNLVDYTVHVCRNLHVLIYICVIIFLSKQKYAINTASDASDNQPHDVSRKRCHQPGGAREVIVVQQNITRSELQQLLDQDISALPFQLSQVLH